MNYTTKSLPALVIGSLGIIYGDIGTSPLYAMNEVFFGHAHFAVTPENVAGVSSLIFWIFVIIVCFKYVIFLLKADYDGEGGPFALMNVLAKNKKKKFTFISFLLLFSTGLLFGDGIITPAISVLSAIEGLKVVQPALESRVLPITIIVLISIFTLQRFGSSSIGKVYGPIMLVWFFSIGTLGLFQVFNYPLIILYTINPLSAWHTVSGLTPYSFALLISSVFLVITGGEALYTDLGHFGRDSIRISWFFIVFPALILNYMGQSAYLLSGQTVLYGNLFYSLAPSALLIPLIILATMATFIASVALIFGIYSITAQAIAMRIIPRMKIYHTNEEIEGQIYIPFINWLLFLGSFLLVLYFRTASNLAAAYGLSVSGVMLTTSIALLFVSIYVWGWKKFPAIIVFGGFIIIDTCFAFSNSIKFLEGGYIPLLLGCSVFFISSTWRWGRSVIRNARHDFTKNRNMKWLLALKQRTQKARGVLKDDKRRNFVETDRAVVFLVSKHIAKLNDYVPTGLRVYLKARGSIPKNLIILTIVQTHTAYVRSENRYEIVDFGNGVYSAKASFGFMEKPDTLFVLKYLYKKEVFDDKFLRCTLEVSEDDFIVEKNVRFKYKILTSVFRFLAKNSIPRYKYFGFHTDVTPGISKTIVPIHIGSKGVYVDIPEFAFEASEKEKLRSKTSPKAVKFRDMWKVGV